MKKISIFLIQFIVLITLFLSGEKILSKKFIYKGRSYNIDVESNPSGSDVILSLEKRKNLSLSIGGENLFPKVHVSKEKYFITWVNYRKENVKLGFYNSCENESSLINLKKFKFVSSDTSVILRSGKPYLLIFRGEKNFSNNEDIFIYNILSGIVKRVTSTPENEKTIDIPDWDLSGSKNLLLKTKTLYYEYTYSIKITDMSVELLEKKKIVRGKSGLMNPSISTEAYNTIVAFGDSITWGKMRMFDLDGEEHPELTYWYKASEYLTEHYGETFTINLGVNGNTSYQGVERMDTDFPLNPGYFCLVLFGTNDVGSGSFSADSSVENIKWIMNNAIKSYGMFPVVSTIPPIKKYIPGVQFFKENTEELNSKIVIMAVEEEFPYFDTYSVFMNYPDGWEALVEDIKGNHPNPTGHQIMADLVVPKILSAIPKKPEILNISSSSHLINIGCTENFEFDFDSYDVKFGYSPDRLEFDMNFPSNQFSLIRSPGELKLRDTIYFKVSSVDKSGNHSGFTQVYQSKFKD